MEHHLVRAAPELHEASRSVLHPTPSAASITCSYRNREWWEHAEKKNDDRVKHPRALYPRLMLAESQLPGEASDGIGLWCKV